MNPDWGWMDRGWLWDILLTTQFSLQVLLSPAKTTRVRQLLSRCVAWIARPPAFVSGEIHRIDSIERSNRTSVILLHADPNRSTFWRPWSENDIQLHLSFTTGCQPSTHIDWFTARITQGRSFALPLSPKEQAMSTCETIRPRQSP